MSNKIPFLKMFSGISIRAELEAQVTGWMILSAAIDRTSRSAAIVIEVPALADGPLVQEVERAVIETYQLASTQLEFQVAQSRTGEHPGTKASEEGAVNAPKCVETPSGLSATDRQAPDGTQDAFARTEAIRREAMKRISRGISPGSGKDNHKNKQIFGRPVQKQPVPIQELELDMGMVVVEGDVFCVDNRELKKRGAWVVAFDVTDYTGSIRVSKFFPGDEGKPIVDNVRKGLRLRIQGRLNMDRFYGDMVLEPLAIMQVEKPLKIDQAQEKRVELHLHTTMSAMDALTSVSPKQGPDRNVVKRAETWGHRAIAITDHGVAQSFPDAWHSAKQIKVIYGVEAYYINDVDDRVAIHGACKQTLQDEIVCFDIETTGLDKRRDVLIEIGAVVLSNGEIGARFNTFVAPGRILSPEIIRLTGITDEMLVGAPSQEEALCAFLAFVGNRPLAAHNAEFDIGFISEGCQKFGIPFPHTSIDSLILAQNLLPELSKFKLNIVAKHLGLPDFQHHRASDDAATVAYMLPHFWKMLEKKGVSRLDELNGMMAGMRNQGRARRQAKHLIILAKNQMGLRNLYKLISLSHLEHFKRVPVMPKHLINENREGLILGSACESGELFDAIVKGKDFSELKRIASWYDYLEIQPICNNMFMLRKEMVHSEEELRDFNRTIVTLGRELDKPVCATGDVHFLDPEDEIYRHILLTSKGFEDADESLPLYFKTTEEMLEEFSYLGAEAAREVVIKNTNFIADCCEPIAPLPKGLFAPKLENSEGELRHLVWRKVNELYGEKPPRIVLDRINVELGDIIGCNYDVIYMSAQKLVQNSLEHGYLVGSRGSVGSSLVAFMSGITEVNSLPAHYRCSKCKHADFEFGPANGFGCGADMPDQNCPVCGTPYVKDGFNIPFETFLGFGGDKVPDIDLNFSGEYQPNAHKYTFELFGQNHVFRAGTVGTVAEKTAFGYVKKYLEEKGITVSRAEENRLALGCTGVKRTTGQHPGGMVVIPQDKEIFDFCPVQHPADDLNTDIVTTHFEYHSMESNLLKLDILGHDDPSMIRMLQDLTGVDPQRIPLDDKKTMSIFKSSNELGFEHDRVLGPTGACAIPEFGTSFVRGMLVDTRPDQFDTLVRLSGFSHGTDVWLGNAKDLITSGTATVQQAIGCRDDIMLYLISCGMDEKRAFQIMESVRKGRGLPNGAEQEMKELNVPDWYIQSCKKIAYLFPKAHAVAYVMMAFRIAWFKVHRPLAFYAAYFSIRAKAFDEQFMCRGMDVCQQKMRQIIAKDKEATAVELDMLTTLEVCYEFYLRGYTFSHIDLYGSEAILFRMDEEKKILTPPFTSVAGLGESAAISLVDERRDKRFISIEEVAACTKLSKTHIEMLKSAGAFGDLPDTSQLDLFSMFG